MAFLFEVINKTVVPNSETLLIYPFKDIWERDKSKTKETAKTEFAYIEFSTSMLKTNPFREYREDIKKEKILSSLRLPKNWKEDKYILDAIEIQKDFQTNASTTYTLYVTAKTVKEKLEDDLRNLNIHQKNFKTGNPLYKPKDVTSALLDIDKVATSLDSLKKKLEEELFEITRKKGSKEISIFANPDSL